ncbi:MAG: DUF4136 domain-containing protein [Pseudomonadota bacterium]
MAQQVSIARSARVLAAGLAALLLVACAVQPKVRSQTAPGVSVASFKTYGYFEKLGTDTGPYASIVSRQLKDATDREMQARGYVVAATNPDLLVNFHVETKEKIEGRSAPRMSIGFGRGWGSWRSGYNWGLGINDVDISSTTEGTLTIDVVDRARNELVWAGSAVGRLTDKILADPQPAIDATVPLIFAKYPKTPTAP